MLCESFQQKQAHTQYRRDAIVDWHEFEFVHGCGCSRLSCRDGGVCAGTAGSRLCCWMGDESSEISATVPG